MATKRPTIKLKPGTTKKVKYLYFIDNFNRSS